MAVQNYLSTSSSPFTHPQTAASTTGQRIKRVRSIISIANGDSAGSIYFVAEVPDTAMFDKIWLEGATTSGLSDVDVGLFDNNGNAKVTGTGSADYYADGLNLTSSTGLPTGDFNNPVWNAHINVASSKANQEVYQDAGDVVGPYPATGSTIKSSKYQIGMTINTAATAAGTYVATVEYRCAE